MRGVIYSLEHDVEFKVTRYAARLVELIHPRTEATSPDELAPDCVRDLAPEGRPYLVLNMVSTLDGKATIDWRTKGISSDLDREPFHHLRTQADAVMVGAGTVRAERYGRIAKSEALRGQARAEGLNPDPLAVVVSARLDLPADLPLLQQEGEKVVIATGADAVLSGISAEVEYLRVGDDMPLLMSSSARSTASARCCAKAGLRSTRTSSPPASWTSSSSP